MNRERAQWAQHALETFSRETRMDGEDAETILHDLICNLGHYCCVNDLDFIRIAADAISCWCVERSDPDDNDIGPGPRVSILIPGRKAPMRAWRQSTTTTRKGRGRRI